MMIRGAERRYWAVWVVLFCMGLLYGASAQGGQANVAPAMPIYWKVVLDFEVSADQLKAFSLKLGADLSSVRNTIYNVKGKRVQINTIVTPDAANAEKLMNRLRSMKAEIGLLRKGLIVYEFVGRDDVLPLVAEGRKHLESL